MTVMAENPIHRQQWQNTDRLGTLFTVCVLLAGIVSADEPKLPSGWRVVREGARGSRLSGEPFGKDGGKFTVVPGGVIGIERRIKDTRALGQVVFAGSPHMGRATFGVLLRTDDGAELSLCVVSADRGVKLRFSAKSGGTPAGTRELPLDCREPTLTIVRNGDVFSGTVRDANAGPVSAGSLTWPDLAADATIRLFASCNTASDGPRICSFQSPTAASHNELLGKAMRQWEMGDRKTAETMLLQITETFGYTEETAEALGRLYCEWDRMDDMERVLRAAIKANPKSALLLNSLSWRFVEREIKLDEAVDLAEQAVALAPDKASVTDTLGWAYYLNGNKQAAQKWLEKAVSLCKKAPATNRLDIAIFLHLAQVCEETGNHRQRKELLQDAIAMAREARAALPQKSGYRTGDLGILLLTAGHADEALKLLTEACKLLDGHAMYNPGDVPIYEAMADAHVARKQERDALVRYKRAFDTAACFHMAPDRKRIRRKAMALFE